MANRLALESELIRTSAISAVDYPDLVHQHHVTGVPKTIVNGRGEILGALPEAQYVEQILDTARSANAPYDDGGRDASPRRPSGTGHGD
ncbi:MAG: hypothetical protein GEU99_25185 [Luteitalea sp.]|nr:hypothetical protein [Luteitalea sp.]